MSSILDREAFLYLRKQVRGARDRPRHELRKEHHEIQIVEIVARCRDVAAIDVDRVTYCMKSVEGYADRQRRRE